MTYTLGKAGASIDELLLKADALHNPNILINGNFDIWQRGTSFSGAVYTADRWKGLSGAAFDRTSDVPAGVSAKYSIKTQRTGHVNCGPIYQGIESIDAFKIGKKFTFSCWIKGSQANMTTEVLLRFVDVVGNSTNRVTVDTLEFTGVSTTWQYFTGTFEVNVAPHENNVAAEIVLWVNAASGTEEESWIAQVQLEAGEFATPFEQRPIGEELALCQRYYRQLGWGVSGQSWDTTDIMIVYDMVGSPMRTAPTIIVLSDFTIMVARTISSSSGASIIASSITNYGFRVRISGFTELSVGEAVHIYNDACIALSAEL